MDNNIRNNSGGVINPSMMNGNSNNSISPDSKKVNNKNAKVTLDKNGKPKRKKASRGKTCSIGEQGGIDLCV